MKEDATASNQTWRASLFVLGVAFLPLFAFWTCVHIVWPWRYFDCFDPDGIHFAAGLSLLRGAAPGNVDNPATPLQMLSALLSWITGCGILDLERFRLFAYPLMISLTIVSAFLLVRFVLRDHPIPVQIAVLWLPWLAPEFTMMSRQWCPEALYFPLGAVAITTIFRNFNDLVRWQNAFVVGVAIGAMIGVKFIFVAWFAAALLTVAITNRPAIAIANCLTLGGGTASGFILATLPAIPRYPRMFQWLAGLATKTGQYGSGSSGFVDLDRAGANLIEILLHQKVWTFVAVAVVLAPFMRRPWSRVSIFCLLACSASYALALKQLAPRYLAPTGMIVLLAAVEFLKAKTYRVQQWRCIVGCVLTGLLLVKSLAFDVSIHRFIVAERKESKAALDALLREKGKTSESVVLYGWRAFVPAYAVRFMNSGENHRFDSEVDAEFPNEGVICEWPSELVYPNGKSTWDFMVLGIEYCESLDPKGSEQLRRDHPSWVVRRYVVVKNKRLTAIAE